MASATMTIRLDEEEKNFISEYARTFGTSVSEFMRTCALDRIEDETDLKLWNDAKAEFDANPITYSADEVAKEFGLR